MMTLESELLEIKKQVTEISKKIDELLYNQELVSLMKLSESSLHKFLENEPEVYS